MLTADTLRYDEATETAIAEGNVEISRGPRRLLADRVVYDQRADRVEAEGLDAIADGWLVGALAPRTHGRLPQVTGLLRGLLLRNDAKQYARACRALAKAPTIDRSQLGQPTLLVVGDHDRSTPMAMTERLHREIPVSRVKVISSAAHWVPLEQPDAIAAAILEFLT